tara:strand:- start:570 stop:1160 length:591 start_codon:yes stop_codon:yes gene_type:complete
MVFAKIASTFFQSCQLTTLININWPHFALYTIPFVIPFTDTKCLAGGIGLTQLHFFLGTIYLPLIAFSYLYIVIRREPTMSVRRNELEEIFGFLLLLWYSPLLQSVGQMFKCYNDPSLGGWVLVSDPRVSCEGTPRNIVIVHAFLICTIIGVGLPLAIFVTTRRLRARGELRADSPLASIFEVSAERSEPNRNHIF